MDLNQPEKLARDFGCVFVSSADQVRLDSELVGELPVEWVRRHLVLPVFVDGEACLLTSDPADIESQQHASLVVGHALEPAVAPEAVVRECIQSCFFSRDDSPSDVLDTLGETDTTPVAAVSDLLEEAEGTPVTQFVNRVLRDALRKRASDIHFEPQEDRLRVRYRIDGTLFEQSAPPRSMTEALVSRLKVMGHMDIAERRLPQDGMARVRVGHREFDVRLSTVPVADGERVVLRILDRESALLPLGALGMDDTQLHAFNGLLRQSSGVIAVCGPTGSGKTTTLYAALSSLDSSRRNILTIEDPIEYRLQNIGQIQVKPKIGLTFSQGLRHILRQDPDIVLVGETRDRETADIAIRAALTGHLVFTTLHTNDAAGAVARLVDMGIEPFLLASCLRGALSQRLVRRLCPECGQAQVVSESDARQLGPWAQECVGKTVHRAMGCDACIEGYRGRTGIFELMTVGPEVRELVRETSFSLDALHEAAVRGGMRPMLQDGLARVEEGITTLEELNLAVSQ